MTKYVCRGLKMKAKLKMMLLISFGTGVLISMLFLAIFLFYLIEYVKRAAIYEDRQMINSL